MWYRFRPLAVFKTWKRFTGSQAVDARLPSTEKVNVNNSQKEKKGVFWHM